MLINIFQKKGELKLIKTVEVDVNQKNATNNNKNTFDLFFVSKTLSFILFYVMYFM